LPQPVDTRRQSAAIDGAGETLGRSLDGLTGKMVATLAAAGVRVSAAERRLATLEQQFRNGRHHA